MKGYSDEPPHFYSGDQLRNHFRVLIEGAEKVKIASAWITHSDMLQLLVSQAQNGAGRVKIQVVVGVGGYYTSPVVLKQLGSTAGIELRVYGNATKPPLFHPKLYIFQHKHWRRVLIGSMNFTRAGTIDNVESVYSFEEKPGIAEREFERFWHSDLAIPFDAFDLSSYEEKRRLILGAVKNAGAAAVLDADVIATADDLVQVDALLEGWKEYVAELKSVPETQWQGCRKVLADRQQLIDRNWSLDFNESELNMLFGTKPYTAFGTLPQLRQSQRQFRGPENRSRRIEIGDAIGKATSLRHDSPREQVEGVVDQLLKIKHCGCALSSRLLVLARPDLFVVVNKKSFAGLQKRFGVTISQGFTPRTYCDLLQKIWKEKWFQSPEPQDRAERDLWIARTALLDLLVYSETATTAK